jgi:DNA ligase (NAD+)
LEAGTLAAMERLGEKSAANILKGIEATKSVPFERLLFALGIRFVGETVARKLARAFGSLDALAAAGVDDLVKVDDVGLRIAESVVDYLASPANQALIERLREAGLNLAVSTVEKPLKSTVLEGKSIVISGTFTRYSRDQYKK